MSANNQILVKEYNGKWYVFNDVMAESWDEKNELSIKNADGVFNTKEEAYNFSFELDDKIDEDFGFPNSEYGVHMRLAKDGADVKLTE